MTDCLIVAMLVASFVLFTVGRAMRKKRIHKRKFVYTKSIQAGGINRRKYFSQSIGGYRD